MEKGWIVKKKGFSSARYVKFNGIGEYEIVLQNGTN